jgi:3-oxoacyl-[acyl-carrier-protein] synthase II
MSGAAVITGMGVICPSGQALGDFQRNLWGGKSAIELVKFRHGGQEYGKWVARVKDFDPTVWMDKKVIEGSDLGQQYAIVAAELAQQDAGIDEFDPLRTAIVSGSSGGGMTSLQQAQFLLDKHGFDAVPGKTMIRIFGNMAAAQMAMRWGLHGPQITLCQACATGIDVVGTAADLVRRGKVDVAIAGAYDATTGFDHPFIDDDFVPALRAAQTTYGMAADPETSIPSKPFDKNRTGSVSSEGAAFVIVESEEHAAARDRSPLAVV